MSYCDEIEFQDFCFYCNEATNITSYSDYLKSEYYKKILEMSDKMLKYKQMESEQCIAKVICHGRILYYESIIDAILEIKNYEILLFSEIYEIFHEKINFMKTHFPLKVEDVHKHIVNLYFARYGPPIC